MMRALKALAREPVVHFLLLGGALFALWGVLAPPSDDADTHTAPHVIEVTPERVDALVAEHERKSGRTATPDARERLVDAWLREEVLVREARALGLDRRDTVVRRRLVQLMEIVLDDALAVPKPTEETLRTWVADNEGLYRRPARISLQHVFIDPKRHEDPNAYVSEQLGALRRGGDWRRIGDAWTRARTLEDRSRTRLQADYGKSFLEVFEAPVGKWIGPIRSSYGLHLVKVTERDDAGVPPFAEIREQAQRDWRSEQRHRARRDAIDTLMERYEIHRPAG